MKKSFVLFLTLCWPATGMAQTTATYTYDALGRLTNSATSGGINNGLNTHFQYDRAGNRTTVTVSGAVSTGDDTGDGASTPQRHRVIVLPLNGYTVIPLS